MADTEKLRAGGMKDGLTRGKRCLIAFIVILGILILAAVAVVLYLYVFAPQKLGER